MLNLAIITSDTVKHEEGIEKACDTAKGQRNNPRSEPHEDFGQAAARIVKEALEIN